MPGPVIKPKSFPGVSSLPAPIQGLVNAIFSPEDPLGGLSPTPLVSLYRNPEVRKRFTEYFLENAKRLYPEHLVPQIERLTQRYPRVAAHIKLRSGTPLTLTQGEQGVTNWGHVIPNEPMGFEGGRFGVTLSKSAAQQAGSPDVLAHEMTHVAQRLGNKQAPELYELAMRGLEKGPTTPGRVSAAAYMENPFERSARITALRATRGGFKGVHQRVPEQFDRLLGLDPENPFLRTASRILKERSGR